MTVGTQDDILARIKALLPYRWFPDSTPVLDALLSGIAWGLALVYSLIAYASAQTRIATASDGFLDLIAYDFFGNGFPRRPLETDSSYRTRILATLFKEKATRNGMIQALTLLTGRAPIIFEPSCTADSGAWDRSSTAWSSDVGGWGSLEHPAQIFITAFRPAIAGIPNIVGWDGTGAGWSTAGQNKWSSQVEVEGAVTDSDIYALIAQVKPAGTIAWVQISN